MQAVSTCPEPASLQDYLLGRVTEATAAAVEKHLASCPQCRTRLPRLQAEDDFTASFRAEARTPDPSDPQLERLAERVRALLRAAPAGDDTTPPAAEASAQTPALVGETTPDKNPSLLPAQLPDEIGRLGGYRILKELGRGGMGVVYKAEDPKLKRLVALKVMLSNVADASSRQRFLREAQAMAAVRHDHVVTVFQVDEAGGAPFLAMEFLEGMTLDQWLKSGRRPTVAQILRIGLEIAEGLAAAHERGLIHRDVKPSNVWLDSSHKGRVKILDFGLARAGKDDVQLTRSGAIVGTPAYMAPEQARGQAVDARCDLFSLGCVLYKVCTGVTPFTGGNTMAQLTSLAVDTPKPVRDLNPAVPPGLADLVMRLLEKDPAKRPASAGEVVQALQALEKQPAPKPEGLIRTDASAVAPPPVAAVVPAPALAVPAPRSMTRRRLLWAVAAAVGLIGLVAAALIRIQTPQGDYVINTDDPDFSFQVHGDAVVLKDSKNNKTYTLKVVQADKGAGQFELDASEVGGDLAFSTKKFTIKRGETAALTAWFEPVVAAMPPADPDKGPAAREYVIDTDDPNFSFLVHRDAVVLKDGKNNKTYTLKVVKADQGAGQFELDASEVGGDLSFRTNKFTIKRGERAALTAWLEPKGVASRLPNPLPHPARDGLDWPPKECVALLGDPTGRHWGEVKAVAYRPDGAVIATADQVGDRAFIHLWDAATLTERAAWTPAGPAVSELAYAPDGGRLAAASADGLRLWDASPDGLSHERRLVEPGSKFGPIPLHVLFPADGQSLLAWDDGGHGVRRWRLTKDACEPTEPDPAKGIRSLVVSADGRTMAYAFGNRLAVKRLFDPQAAESAVELPAVPITFAVSADGKRLAARTPGPAGDLRVWDIDGASLKLRRTPVDVPQLAASNSIKAFLFTPDGERIVNVSGENGRPLEASLFDANTVEPKPEKALPLPDGVTCLAMAADGRSVASGCTDHLLHVGDLTRGLDARPNAQGPVRPVRRLAFRRGGKELALVYGAPSNLLVWDIPNAKCNTLSAPAGGWFTDCAYTPDGSRLFAVGKAPLPAPAAPTDHANLLRIYPREKAELKPDPEPDLSGLQPFGDFVDSLVFSRDGKTLLLYGNRSAAVFDGASLKLRGKPFTEAGIGAWDSLAVSPDGATAAFLPEWSGQVTLLDLKGMDTSPPPVIQGPPLRVVPSQNARRMTFSPDGKALAALAKLGQGPGDSCKVMVWDVATGKPRLFGRGSDDKPVYVQAFAFAPDGQVLATADSDGRVSLWRTDRPEQAIGGWQFPGAVSNLAFDDSGALLAATNGDGTIAVMRLPAPAP
jgi:WD40 repeat protein/tRNA A-37 threonylcarbamoyl transferase component Bud32